VLLVLQHLLVAAIIQKIKKEKGEIFCNEDRERRGLER
jgi:hypothetical protein